MYIISLCVIKQEQRHVKTQVMGADTIPLRYEITRFGYDIN